MFQNGLLSPSARHPLRLNRRSGYSVPEAQMALGKLRKVSSPGSESARREGEWKVEQERGECCRPRSAHSCRRPHCLPTRAAACVLLQAEASLLVGFLPLSRRTCHFLEHLPVPLPQSCFPNFTRLCVAGGRCVYRGMCVYLCVSVCASMCMHMCSCVSV